MDLELLVQYGNAVNHVAVRDTKENILYATCYFAVGGAHVFVAAVLHFATYYQTHELILNGKYKKLKLSLCSEHHAIKTYWGLEV
jgi:hypothetical protein